MRTARWNVPGRIYHLISRFIDREFLILDEVDRALYLRLLGSALAKSDWLCVAYALMSNHIHLAMRAGRQPLAEWMRCVHAPFADELNKRRRRIGPVFIRGPKDYLIDPGDTGGLIAYIHRNPVRANVVEYARESTWTSHRAYIGFDRAPSWLAVNEGLTRAGFADGRDFDRWVNATEGESGAIRLEAFRRAVRKRGAIEIATPSRSEVPLVTRPFAFVRPDPRAVVEAVAYATSIPHAMLGSRARPASIVNARRIAIHVARALGIAACDIGAALGITRQAASKLAAAPVDQDTEATIASIVHGLTAQRRRDS